MDSADFCIHKTSDTSSHIEESRKICISFFFFAILRSLSISPRVAHVSIFLGKRKHLVHFLPRRQEDPLRHLEIVRSCDLYEGVEYVIARTVPRSRRPSSTRCFYENKFHRTLNKITLRIWESDPRKKSFSILFIRILLYSVCDFNFVTFLFFRIVE